MDATDPSGAVLQRLVAYWRAHPMASDTLDGICQWWMADPSVPRAQVEAALRQLTERQQVAAHRAADGRVRYRWVDAAATGSGEPS